MRRSLRCRICTLLRLSLAPLLSVLDSGWPMFCAVLALAVAVARQLGLAPCGDVRIASFDIRSVSVPLSLLSYACKLALSGELFTSTAAHACRAVRSDASLATNGCVAGVQRC